MIRIKRVLSALVVGLVLTTGTAVAQRNCVKGKPCGNSCIARDKVCRVGTGSATTGAAAAATTSQGVVPPEGARYVASTQGQTYYNVFCAGWRSLARANLRWFSTSDEAVAAGLRPSTQPGCGAITVMPGATGTAATPGAVLGCTVSAVIDGDTFSCADSRRVRLLLVDAPEMDQGEYGKMAKAKLEELLAVGALVRLEYDVETQDRYGRDLAYVVLATGKMVNEELARAGMVVVSVYPPNVKHVERMRAAVAEGRLWKRGLWTNGAFTCEPADFRAGRCGVTRRHPMDWASW